MFEAKLVLTAIICFIIGFIFSYVYISSNVDVECLVDQVEVHIKEIEQTNSTIVAYVDGRVTLNEMVFRYNNYQPVSRGVLTMAISNAVSKCAK